MSEKCRRLHEILEELPLVRYPFELETLPFNGIYFFPSLPVTGQERET